MDRLAFLFGLHIHQPLGNFDHVIRRICEECYRPLFSALSSRRSFRFSLHVSGLLLDWLDRNEPKLVDLIGELVAANRVELLLAGWAEPVLPAIPRRDRLGQIARMRETIRARFGAEAKGLWLTERVWEPGLAEDLAAAGVEYVLVDDRHFRISGFPAEALGTHYRTESEGGAVSIFPISKTLRYLIPFRPAREIAEHLRSRRAAGAEMAIFADDGEKFGAWPGTHGWVFRDRWLEKFLDEMEGLASEFLDFLTFSEALARFPSGGICYLPTASYSEMEEWTLPPAAAKELESLKDRLGPDLAERYSPWLRGGHWKHFFVKYPEANRMHKKMLALSGLASTRPRRRARVIDDLYASQCNDAYWHGVFGGLYLPHLRHAVWRKLARVEEGLRRGEGIEIETVDLDRDGRPEVWAHSQGFSAVLDPSRGGRLVEHTVFEHGVNLLNVLTRRREAYLVPKGTADGKAEDGGVASIHDLTKQVDPAILAALAFDPYERAALIEHVFPEGTPRESFERACLPELASLAAAPFEATIGAGKVRLGRLAPLASGPGSAGSSSGGGAGKAIHLQKDVSFLEDGAIEVHYHLTNKGMEPLSFRFGVEWNLALPGLGDGRGTIEVEGWKGPSENAGAWKGARGLRVEDPGSRLAVTIGVSDPAEAWSFPVATVSQSESGYEKTIQGLAFLLHWPVHLLPNGSFRVEVGVAARGIRTAGLAPGDAAARG